MKNFKIAGLCFILIAILFGIEFLQYSEVSSRPEPENTGQTGIGSGADINPGSGGESQMQITENRIQGKINMINSQLNKVSQANEKFKELISIIEKISLIQIVLLFLAGASLIGVKMKEATSS